MTLFVIVENAVFWHHSLENNFQSYGKWELAYSHSYLWWPGQFVLTYFNFKAKIVSFYKSFLYLNLYLLHILFDLMTLLYYWCLCILEIYSISPLGICTVFLKAGALEHYWVPVMTYANWDPSSCRQMIYKSGFVGLDWRYWFSALQFGGLKFLQKQRSWVWNVFFDMVLIKVEKNHTTWETAFLIWMSMLGGSQLKS